MNAASWLLWAALSTAATALSVWHYRRRETPGRGRLTLAILRSAAFALLLLLLFDPSLPGTGQAGTRGTMVLLDASISMSVEDDGATAWADAISTARGRAGDRPVLLFGDHVRPMRADSLPDTAPGDATSRLLPALHAAAEAGVGRVLVITDGRIDDLDEAAAWAPRLGLEIETETVGGDVANRSVTELSAPAWAQAGQPVAIRFGVSAPAGDSVSVVARRDGRVLARTTVAAPSAGRTATGSLDVTLDAPAGGAAVPIEVAVEGGDRVPDDDARTAFIEVSAQPAGIAIVSLQPDWEPRFLAPVLEQALGLPLRAYLRTSGSTWIRLGTGLDAGTAASEADVREAVARAEFLVLHGLGADAPAWAREAAASARRLLVFPADAAAPLPLPVAPAVAGDWFVAPAVPASPVAPLLAGIDASVLPPLASVFSTASGDVAWAPLLVTRGRQGPPQPLLAAGEEAGRRWVVALGSGTWQWAFRGGAERQAYTRLWSAMAGWLAGQRTPAGTAAVRPAQRVVPRGAGVAWLATAAALDSVRITLTGADGATAMDTVIAGAGTASVTSSAGSAVDTIVTRALPPGTYSYGARAYTADGILDAAGSIVVERYSADFARPRRDLSVLAEGTVVREGGGAAAPVRTGAGRPLHTSPWPYVLLLALLSAEWVLRRRWGLR